MVPIELMNARPPAAATPVRKRGGMLQNKPRAPFIPIRATVTHATDSQKCDAKITAPRNPAADTRHDRPRCTILRPCRSTWLAQRIIAALASRYDPLLRNPISTLERWPVLSTR